MKFALGSDMDMPVVHRIAEELGKLGHEVTLFGAMVESPSLWSTVALQVAKKVASGAYDNGVLFCWTGTGISLAANKVKGIRAALCNDAETAAGARKWNDANILAMSLRSTTEQVAKEILKAWLSNDPSTDPEDVEALKFLYKAEEELYKQ